jgi:uncharacterized membrane protein
MMSSSTTHPTDPPPFRALLTPHRSLSRTGFLILMGSISLVSFAVGVAFVSMGAWPVAGFFGLDVLLIYYAFRANYRAARAYETVEITSEGMTITRVDQHGRSEAFHFNPYWVRVQLAEEPSGHTKLSITSHGRSFLFGLFLSDDDRRDFARALTDELHARRSYVPTGH